MDRDLRNRLSSTVLEARSLLEADFRDQLESQFNIMRDGAVGSPGPGSDVLRRRLLDVREHFIASGATTSEAVARLVREQAFTALNRFVGLKLAEEREVIRACVGAGIESAGVAELLDLAPGLNVLPDRGYRLALETMMDELGLDLALVFDRAAPTGVLWPRPHTLSALLTLINDDEIKPVWLDDETLGWVYQYFNADEVSEMREASAAPRDSRELAVRNQFFTPDYVVRFLTDNTLGRLWAGWMKGETRIAGEGRLLIPSTSHPVSSQPKDPRDIRVLDPACGSGHFLLYAFDLLLSVYEEAWEKALEVRFSETGKSLRDSYTTLGELQVQAPALILRHNLYGLEIDPRCAQVASLALWLRAQRQWRDMGVPKADRPAVTRANIVVAEAPDDALDREQLEAIGMAPVVIDILLELRDTMRQADVLGYLLRPERALHQALEERRLDAEQADIFTPHQTESEQWHRVHAQIIQAVDALALRGAEDGVGLRGRLFADDMGGTAALVAACLQKYDVVLMNPPFGDAAEGTMPYLRAAYPRSKQDLYTCFVERGLELLHPGGHLGAITNRTGFFLRGSETWRREVVLGMANPTAVADLGYPVMDGAMVESAAYCLERQA